MDKREELRQQAIAASLAYGEVQRSAGVMEGTGDPEIDKGREQATDKARRHMVAAINALANFGMEA